MLLDEIVDIAINDQGPIGVLLKKCLLLSHQLRNEELKIWVLRELNGYSRTDSLPEYRMVDCGMSGQFVSNVGTLEKIIPSLILDSAERDFGERVRLTQPISAYEDIVLNPGQGRITIPWPHNLVLKYQDKLLDGWTLNRAWHEVPRTAIVEVLNVVRTRALNMALEIQRELGAATDLTSITPDHGLKIQQTIMDHISLESSKTQIFISHSNHDEIVAAALTELLKNALEIDPETILCTSVEGHGLPVGAKTEDVLKSELLGARCFIALLSPASLSSIWVLFEIGARWGGNKHLAPVLAGGLSFDQLRGPLPGINAFSCNSDSQLQRLIYDVSQLLGVRIRRADLYAAHLRRLMEVSSTAAREI